jgi:mannan endo-1,4-beta-mannosidase
LQRLDNVIETAGKHGIKIILAFTNNWSVVLFIIVDLMPTKTQGWIRGRYTWVSSCCKLIYASRARTFTLTGLLDQITHTMPSLQIQRLLLLTVSVCLSVGSLHLPSSVESYVRTLVERYKDSSNIFAWELMNEARCSSDSFPSGPSCTPASGAETLLQWYQMQSDFVRSL